MKSILHVVYFSPFQGAFKDLFVRKKHAGMKSVFPVGYFCRLSGLEKHVGMKSKLTVELFSLFSDFRNNFGKRNKHKNPRLQPRDFCL